MHTGEQIRAARAMLRMEQTQLAEKSGVSVETIKRLEATNGRLKAKAETLKNIRTSLEFAGIEFTDHRGPGVRLMGDPTKAFADAMTEQFSGMFRAALTVHLQDNPDALQGSKKELIQMALKTVEGMAKKAMMFHLPGK